MASDTEPPRKKIRYLADDGPSIESKAIVVRVGEVKQEFYVHEKRLRASSEFFDRALKKEWREGQEAAVDLPDAEPKYFRAWVKFLYTGRVYIGQEKGGSVPKDGISYSTELVTWRHLYALGGFLRDVDFEDALIDAMIDRMITFGRYPLDLATYIYPHTKQDSNHR